MNKYLFNNCFNVDTEIKNALYFTNYLLMNLVRKNNIHSGFKYEPGLEEVSVVLDTSLLSEYWKKNGQKIKDYIEDNGNTIHTYNYSVSFDVYLKPLFKMLDQNI